MIVGFIINGILSALDALFSLFPNFDVPNWSHDGSELAGYITKMNHLFPVATFAFCLGIMLLVELALNLWELALFVYHQFWGSS